MTILHRTDKVYHFKESFDLKTGFHVRTGILTETGEDTGVDPFQGSWPSLLDVGIMGSCIHGERGLCAKAGIGCYQSGKHIKRPNMKFSDFKTIIDEVKGKTFSFALGGRGDPNKHEEFETIMKYCVENNVIPNYTTSGLELTDTEIDITKQYAGAVAVSWYRQQHTTDAISRFLKKNMKTNIHYVLGNNTIDEAIERLSKNDFPNVNAIIFLLHKPVGMGSVANVLKVDDRVKKFFDLVDNKKHPFKIGFDSCTCQFVAQFTSKINPNSITSCDSGCFSAYINSDMIITPCSFDQDLKWGVDLKNCSIEEAWNSAKFNEFRQLQKTGLPKCASCKHHINICKPCPVTNHINICK